MHANTLPLCPSHTHTQDVAVENRLLRIDDNFVSPPHDSVVDISVHEVGAWFVKFRESGVIVNRRDLILANCVEADASLAFSSLDAFWEMASQQSSLGGLIARGQLEAEQRDPLLTPGLGNLFESLGGREIEGRRTRPSSSANLNKKPLKAGWCYKRRDIIMGWRCRYFKIFPGQV
jgi:hypothetical protein